MGLGVPSDLGNRAGGLSSPQGSSGKKIGTGGAGICRWGKKEYGKGGSGKANRDEREDGWRRRTQDRPQKTNRLRQREINVNRKTDEIVNKKKRVRGGE